MDTRAVDRSNLQHDFYQESRQSHAVTASIDVSHCRLDALAALVRKLTQSVVSNPIEADTVKYSIGANARFFRQILLDLALN